MKRLFIFLFLLGLIACEDDHIRIFNSKVLTDLDLAYIDSFWDEGIDIDTTYSMGITFKNSPGFIECIRLSGGEKYVGVSVFESQNLAINAFQARISSVACIIEEGTTDVIKDKWWFGDCIPNIVFVSKLNTIIEVGIYNPDFNIVADTLYWAANEIASRVLNLSE
jgi:hypothetical protein